MIITCLDLEGVLVPEIWIEVSKKTGISDLALTTRDISDYDVLMKKRIALLSKHNLSLSDIQSIIECVEPFDTAFDFVQELRSLCPLVILSDTFAEFAQPLMKKLNYPTLFCNSLVIDKKNNIIDYQLRQDNGKFFAVKAFQSMGLKVIASGDSFNDLAMITQAEKGFLFCPPEHIAKQYSQFKTLTTHTQLLNEIKKILSTEQ
ncbi:MAG: bifunctional phosphoserine phosphatase/homoserine phosphotransferase ThrH [Treponemataceae bacterium]